VVLSERSDAVLTIDRQSPLVDEHPSDAIQGWPLAGQERKQTVVDIQAIRVPEGHLQFTTIVIRNHENDEATATNVVVGADFQPDWNDPSDQLAEFQSTVFAWVDGIQNVARDVYREGFTLVIEDNDEIATADVVYFLD
jgi:hypothetical protein